MSTTQIIAILLILASDGDQSAINYFEALEETCMGWDGAEAQRNADDLGICRYFELEATR